MPTISGHKRRVSARGIRFAMPCAALTLFAAISGCALFESSGRYEEAGLLRYYQSSSGVSVPETVARGIPFEVRVTTFAGGCTRDIARTELVITGLLAEIRPINRGAHPHDAVCTADLLLLTHRVMVTFPTVGVATVRIVGEQQGVDGRSARIPDVIERSVVVR